MLINWFTVLAQVVNFLILILLLKHFLYGPIVEAMQKREDTIAGRLEEAEAAKQQALTRAEALQKERQSLKNEKDQLLKAARQEVIKWRESAMQNARQEIETSRQAWLDSVESEKERFYQQLKTRIAEQVLLLSRKVLRDLADEMLENRLIETFMHKIEKESLELEENALHARQEFLIRSGFTLKDDVKIRVKDTLKKRFPEVAAITFEVEPDFGFGLRLLSGDWKVEWNLAWYMQNLETTILPSLTSGR